MKTLIYSLLILSCTCLTMAQRTSEALVPLVQATQPTIHNFERTSCCFCCCNELEKNTTKGEPTTGYEGHNFIEDPAIIYPNPAVDVINVKSTDPITVIEILNITGETVMDKMMGTEGQYNISDLPAGQYFVRIYFQNRNDVQIEKLLIVK